MAIHRDAFEFIERLESVSTTDAVLDAMQRILGRFGFKFFCFNRFPSPDQKFDEVMLACRVPAEWINLYVHKQYAHVDPTMRHCKRTINLFEWKNAPYDPEREPRAAEMVQRATDFGLSNGVWVPIPGSHGNEGGVWLGGEKLDLTSRSKPIIHLMALYAFERVRLLHTKKPRQGRNLTARENEVLAWVANGKTAWEIGKILHITTRVVDRNTQTAFRKLGAVNRTQAVAIALRDHLIEI